jgi:hypothetical protein
MAFVVVPSISGIAGIGITPVGLPVSGITVPGILVNVVGVGVGVGGFVPLYCKVTY